MVNKAVAGLNGVSASQGALGVVGLAMELENIAAETYVKDTVLATKTRNKALFASVMGIEAQHVSVLLAVQALLMAGAPQLISLAPGTAAALPAAAGSVGFPHAFYPTNSAAPARARSRQVSTDHSTNFEGSEYELDALTSELDQLHHDVGMPAHARSDGSDARHQPAHLPARRGCRGRRRCRTGRRRRPSWRTDRPGRCLDAPAGLEPPSRRPD